MKKHPKACSFYSSPNSALAEIDTAYVYLERDVAFPLSAQKAMIATIKSQCINIREVSLPSGHFPSLSMPDRLAKMVLEFT